VMGRPGEDQLVLAAAAEIERLLPLQGWTTQT
jgi:Asp-tRNA(Asn)/Glu-tRNA(Gln) amidotransferase A subunit family amidase